MIRDLYEAYTVYSFYWLIRYYLGDNIEKQLATMNAFNYYHAHKEITRLEDILNNPLGVLTKKEYKILEKYRKFIEEGNVYFNFPLIGDLPYSKYNCTSVEFLNKTEKYVLLYIVDIFNLVLEAYLYYFGYCIGRFKCLLRD